MLGSTITALYGKLYVFKKLPNYFPFSYCQTKCQTFLKWLYHFILPLTKYQRYRLFISLPAFGFVTVFNFTWSNRWVVVSQPRNQSGLFCIAGAFFTSWATRKPRVEIMPLCGLFSPWCLYVCIHFKHWAKVYIPQIWGIYYCLVLSLN